MAVIKCRMCGGSLSITEDSSVCECEYCGSKQTVPRADDEKKLKLFERAGKLLRACEFDKASAVFETIAADFPEEAEAYWGLVLCKYGIEYVDDPATGKKVPTCHRSSFDNVMKDPNFEQACENTDAVARRVYRDEARAIEELRRKILDVSGREEPYDVFISYKEKDENGERTPDSVIAQDIYRELTREGWRVFFSRISLEGKLGVEYEPYIFAALNSARVMIVVGTDYEHFDAVWVKNEWSRFLKLIAKGEKKTLIPVFRDMDAYDMPEEFSKLTALDMGRLGAMQDLVHGVEKIVGRKKDEPAAQVVQQTVVQGGPNVTAMIERGHQALEDGEWDKAEDFFNQALNMDAKCAEAFLGIALAKKHCVDLKGFSESFLRWGAAAESLALERDQARIDETCRRLAVPGYLSEEELQKLYDFGESYPSSLRNRQTIAEKGKLSFQSDRNLARAFRYARGDTLQALEELKKAVYDGLDRQVEQARQEEEAARAEARVRYAAALEKADARAEAKSREAAEALRLAEQQREEAYQAAAQIQAAAGTTEDFLNAQQAFLALGTYKDAADRAEDCGESIVRLAEEEARQRKENEYQAACRKQEAAKTETDYRSAELVFRTLGSFRDAAVRARECRNTYTRMQNERWERMAREKTAAEKRKRIRWIIVAASVVLALALFTFVKNVIIPPQRYKTAEAAMEAGDYSKALSGFLSLGDYKDAPDRANEARYAYAAAMLAEGNYEIAWTYYQRLGDYKDAPDRAEEAGLAYADERIAAEDYQTALEILRKVSDDPSVTEKIEAVYEILYQQAMTCAAAGDYRGAREALALVDPAYGDSGALQTCLQFLETDFDDGKLHSLQGLLSAVEAAPTAQMKAELEKLPQVKTLRMLEGEWKPNFSATVQIQDGVFTKKYDDGKEYTYSITYVDGEYFFGRADLRDPTYWRLESITSTSFFERFYYNDAYAAYSIKYSRN